MDTHESILYAIAIIAIAIVAIVFGYALLNATGDHNIVVVEHTHPVYQPVYQPYPVYQPVYVQPSHRVYYGNNYYRGR
jgi:hypothetical protein